MLGRGAIGIPGNLTAWLDLLQVFVGGLVAVPAQGSASKSAPRKVLHLFETAE